MKKDHSPELPETDPPGKSAPVGETGAAEDSLETASENEPVPADDDDVETLDFEADPLMELQQQNAELENRLVRAQAEMENIRKRSRREIEESRKYQNLDIVRSLLPAIDNLDRALAAAEQQANIENLVTGVKMVNNQFGEIFGQFGVKKIEALGQPFDPNLHEALQQVATDEHSPMTVIQDVEPGYILHDRVVRPSKVIVSIAATPDE